MLSTKEAPMTENFPNEFAIEIDRDGLARYFERTYLTALLWTFGGLGFVSGFIFGTHRVEALEPSRVLMAVGLPLLHGTLAALPGLTLGWLLYAVVFRRQAHKAADATTVTVEGPYLRLRTEWPARTDRKLHFRAIVDYASVESKAQRKCGIQALLMTTIAGGQNPCIRIPGIKDCLAVRDLLAEIDSQREYGYPQGR
jgi:hypothetical protein